MAATATDSAAAGVDGYIVPDLPADESDEVLAACRREGLDLIFLLAPTSTEARIEAAARHASGFLYCVSLVGVTGARTSLPASVGKLVRDVKAASPVPVAVGFGVSTPAHVRMIAKAGSDGVVVASALVDALGPDGRDIAGLSALVGRLREATATVRT